MRIASLHTFPVKGCHRLDHDAARVGPAGLGGDRRWMITDPDGVGVTLRETTALVRLRPQPRPGGLVLCAPDRPDLDVAEPADGPTLGVRIFRNREPAAARHAGPAADAWLSDLVGRPVRLVWMPAPDATGFADERPLLIANAASLDALNAWLDEAVPITRFRPNIVIDGAGPWAEDDWTGRPLRAGAAVLRVVGPCDRCVVTTIDMDNGDKGREPLVALGRHRRTPQGLLFGVHAAVDVPGLLRVGDEVAVL